MNRKSLSFLAGVWLGACGFDRPECLQDMDCGPGAACVRGACAVLDQLCEVDDDCHADESCVAGVCMIPGRCLLDVHCGADERCEDGACLPIRCIAGACADGLVCEDGQCVAAACTDPADCPSGFECDPLDGVCRRPSAIPVAERCNGADDDLDGEIDEGFAVGTACSAGTGSCSRPGVLICGADGDAICSATPAMPSPERCNGLDDDCDGEVDEAFPDLGVACVVGEGQCLTVGHTECTATGDATACVPDTTLPAPQPELCNGLDDDCDGLFDEDFPLLDHACVGGVEPCTFEGWWRCDGEKAVCEPGLDPYPFPEDCP